MQAVLSNPKISIGGANVEVNSEITVRTDKIMIQTGPYDNSDMIIIEFDRELNEYRVIHDQSNGTVPECVFSIEEEEV